MMRAVSRLFDVRSLLALLAVLAVSLSTTAHSAPVPTDDEQEILVKSTLMTLNDANLTGNYSVLFARASKQFQAQLSPEQVAEKFKLYREKKVNLDSIAGDELDSSKKASIDKDGVLNLKGRFKDDEKRIGYDLNYVYQDGAWKLLGISVNFKQE